jgi:hypothetical protein
MRLFLVIAACKVAFTAGAVNLQTVVLEAGQAVPDTQKPTGYPYVSFCCVVVTVESTRIEIDGVKMLVLCLIICSFFCLYSVWM